MAGSFTEDIKDGEDIEDVELEPAARHVEAAEHQKKTKKRSSTCISIEDLAETSILQPRHRMLDMSSLRFALIKISLCT